MKNNRLGGLIVGLLVMLLIAPVSQAAAEPEAKQLIMTDTDSKNTYLKMGFVLMKETIGPLGLGMSADEVVSQLGAPEEKSDAKIWGADHMEHQFWYYPAKGIELGMVKKDGTQEVERIVIKNVCVYETQRGIKIGSSAAEVQAAYKDVINPGDSHPGEKIVCGTVYGGIIFELKNDVVSAIFIGAAAE